MLIRAGYEIAYDCPQPTPMLLMLSVHPSRTGDLAGPEGIRFEPPVPVRHYVDAFGNRCSRVVAPAGRFTVAADFAIRDSGRPDPVRPEARELPVAELPDEALVFLLGSRYCDTDRLTDFAWAQFGHLQPGWTRVQAICDYVHNHIGFDYMKADATRSASEGHRDRVGVCRDFAHLAVTLCRCMNIPARYCTGYLGDIGVPADPAPMDFSAWFEVLLEGGWYAFDARHNRPRIGRILMARGRDATDVALSTGFGRTTLAGFQVITEQVG